MSTEQHFPKILGTATLNEKGQLVIPSAAREAYGLKAGSKLVIMKGMRKPVLVLIKAEEVEAMIKNLANALESDS